MFAIVGAVSATDSTPFLLEGLAHWSTAATIRRGLALLSSEGVSDLQRAFQRAVSSEKLGKARRIDAAASRYTEYCKANLPGHLSLNGLKIVVDSANGAAYKVAPAVYSELGAELISIHASPNDLNINEHCGATSMQSLRAAVLELQADL